MTNNQVFRGALTALAGIFLCTVSPSLLAAQEANAAVYAAMKGNPKLRLVQTNSCAIVFKRRHSRGRPGVAVTNLHRRVDSVAVAGLADPGAAVNDRGYRMPLHSVDLEFVHH